MIIWLHCFHKQHKTFTSDIYLIYSKARIRLDFVYYRKNRWAGCKTLSCGWTWFYCVFKMTGISKQLSQFSCLSVDSARTCLFFSVSQSDWFRLISIINGISVDVVQVANLLHFPFSNGTQHKYKILVRIVSI